MFDIAFSELVVIAIVALMVIGPERLPKVARMIGALMGRMQKYMTQIKEEVNREARFAELQKLQEEIRSAGSAAQQSLQSASSQIAQDLPVAELEQHQIPVESPSAESTLNSEYPSNKE